MNHAESVCEYICHGLPHTLYKFSGLVTNQSPVTDLEGPNGIWYMRLSTRMFAPFLCVTVYQPHRRAAWRLKTEPFDYRHAQHSGALIPTGGEWYSRSWVALEGDLELICPDGDPDMPRLISARIKISWWPAHVTLTWLDGGSGFQKLSARPQENDPSTWITVPYDDTVFTDQMRRDFPRAFLTQPEPCPPRPSDTAPKTDTEPPKTPPIPVTVETSQKKEDSHSSAGTESDYDNEWSENGGGWWHCDWYSSHWNQQEWSPPEWTHEPSWADAPIETPRPTSDAPPITEPSPDSSPHTDTEKLPETIIQQPIVTNPETRPVSPVTDAPTSTAIRMEQVTQVTRTQSVTEISRPPDETQTMIRLQRLALTGAPVTREDRLARQVLANRLHLAPEIYNMLVFGETEDTESPALNDTATCALPPAQTTPQSLLGDG